MPQSLDRRSVLKCIVAVAASTAFACDDEEDVPQEEDRNHFPQSVASGDPRADSVVLWTRAVASDRPDDALRLTLQVSTSEAFDTLILETRDLEARADHDHTVKVKVTNLTPRTRYYYRFIHEQDGRRITSPTGRTRTAPAAGTEETVRFAIANCQDFAGRYYNSWQRLVQLDEDLDFIVFLGDYIYEGPPAQVAVPGREVGFSDPSSALSIPGGSGARLVANSLSNYRDLYKRYRSDPFLQRAHERYPFISVWDDHEYSNDCWGANATYRDGRVQEELIERRRNAELAFFEYVPLDVTAAPGGAMDPGAVPRFPDTRIWRDFEFGSRLRLLVTDYRTRRPDHLIPEDGYPATVVMDQAALQSTGAAAAFASDAFAYVDIGLPQYEPQRIALLRVYETLAALAGVPSAEANARARAAVQGLLALAYVNPVLAQVGQQPIDPAGQPRGLAWVHMGKRNLFDALGSRYIVVKDVFDVYAAWSEATQGRARQDALGPEQDTWLRESASSPHRWKAVVSSVSLTAMVFDLRNKADVPDPALRNRFYFSADQWDGFPTRKRELLTDLRARAGTGLFCISGDIHASFASVEEGVPAVTGPAISSSSVKEEAAETVAAAGFPPESAVFRYAVTEQENTFREGNPAIAFVDSDSHGFTVVEVRADEALAAYHLIPSSAVRTDYSGQPEALAARFTRRDFRIRDGAITPA